MASAKVPSRLADMAAPITCSKEAGWWVVREPGTGNDRMAFPSGQLALAWIRRRVDYRTKFPQPWPPAARFRCACRACSN